MADNVVANAGSGGSTFAADDIGGVLYPRAKVTFGVDGASVDASASNPLPVVQTGTPALPTGASTETTLAAASAKLPATLGQKAMAASMAVTLASDQSTVPVSIASVPSHAVTNAGTFVTQENGAALTALQLIDNLVLAEDAAHSSGDPGVMPLAVRRDADTSLVGTDGDYAPLQVNAAGSLKVAIISGAGSGGTAMADDAAFTVASTSFTPVGGTYISAGDAVNDGDGGAFAMTANRALKVNLVDSAGVELASGAQYTEDSAHVSGDYLTPMGVVRKDTATQIAGTDGDYSMLINDASGRLHTNVGAVPADPFGVNADAASATGSISAKLRFIAATGIPITGTVTVGSHAVTNAGTFAVQAGTAAHDAAISGNPVRTGLRAGTADVTAVSDGDTTDAMATILGKQVIQPYALPANTWNYAAAAGGLVNTTEVTAKAAGAAGVRNYITSIQVMNSHATISSEVIVLDGTAGTVLHRGWAQAAGGGYACKFDPPLRGSTATLVSIKEVTATATAGILVNLQGYAAAE